MGRNGAKRAGEWRMGDIILCPPIKAQSHKLFDLIKKGTLKLCIVAGYTQTHTPSKTPSTGKSTYNDPQ